MKKMRILMILLSLALIFGTLLTFVGCGAGTLTECNEHKDENGDGVCDTEGCGATVEKPVTTVDAFNENGELYLFKGGAPTFQFVIGADAVAKQKGTVEDLANVLAGLGNEGSTIPTVMSDAEVKDVEILIGTVTNRGDQYNINKYDYGNTGYVVKQIGTKIVVTGGSDAAVTNAVKYLKEKVFGIKKNNDKFTNFVMSADKTYDEKQSNYTLKDITIAGKSIKEYVITYPTSDTVANTNAQNLQKSLYDNCGIRIETMLESKAEGKAKISFRTIANSGVNEGFYVSVDENKNLNIECEYAGLSTEITEKYLKEKIFSRKNVYEIAADYSYSEDHRNIYYKDYAVGDGETDDFAAIYRVHEIANENLLNVHADPKQTYRLEHPKGGDSIIVKTNTYWHGCSFIFDDTRVTHNTAAMAAPLFLFERDTGAQEYTAENVPIKSLEKGAANIGWAPGFKALILIQNDNVMHYVRYGTNADSGSAQKEIIYVDENGNVDPSTPIQWTYEAITAMEVYSVDDKPIELRGEDENGKLTTVTTRYNSGPSEYFYYYRNLFVSRSNVTISGVEHIIKDYIPESNGGHGSPYYGFTCIKLANNVTIENFIFENPPVYTDTKSNGNMGSYEIRAELANDITWKNCKQSNFFEPNGTVIFKGLMGTNYCKNLVFDNMFVTSFDAHKGVYNGTIKNSTIEHINFIGAGTINIENVVLYADGWMHSAINFRDDYGSTWDGDVNINGLTIKIKALTEADKLQLNKDGGIRIFNAYWFNHDFGYTTYLPKNVTIRNLLLEEYNVTMQGIDRVETHVSYNTVAVQLFKNEFQHSKCDYYRDAEIKGATNVNPMVPTERIEYYTEYTGEYAKLKIEKKLELKFPHKTYISVEGNGYTIFKDTVYLVDGEPYVPQD